MGKPIDSDNLLEWFKDVERHAFTNPAVSEHQREYLNVVIEDLGEAIQSGDLAAKAVYARAPGDRMLSYRKLNVLLGNLIKLSYDCDTINRIESELELGQLDADRPECPKCNDTGEVRIWDSVLRTKFKCDCGATADGDK